MVLDSSFDETREPTPSRLLTRLAGLQEEEAQLSSQKSRL